MDNRLQGIEEKKVDLQQELQGAVEKMLLRIESETRVRNGPLLTHKAATVDAMETLHKELHSVEIKLQSLPRSSIVSEAGDLSDRLDKALSVPVDHLAEFPDESRLTMESEIVPSWQTSQFQITNFAQRRSSGAVLYSESLCVNGVSWRLKVYPNGTGDSIGVYLSIFLEMVPFPLTTEPEIGFSAPYEYRIELCHHLARSNHRFVSRESTSHFAAGECWGYHRFLLIEQLTTDGYLEHDTLVLRFALRSLAALYPSLLLIIDY